MVRVARTDVGEQGNLLQEGRQTGVAHGLPSGRTTAHCPIKAIRPRALGAKQGQRLGEMISALPAPGSAPGQMQWAPRHPPIEVLPGASQSPLGIRDLCHP